MGDWGNHPDSIIRADGERKLYESYNTVKNPLGYYYIQMIKGLNAFSKSKNYENIIEENCHKISLSLETLESTFQEIEDSSSLFKNNAKANIKEINRYSIITATDILLNCFKQLGQNYYNQAYQLLNPTNGRLDIVGGENRMGMQGVASVYPIDVSIFYANNYQGYYIDLMLLSHEAGHAIQASLMNDNKVSLLNASGPGYFTESFGKFNELLVSYYLYENSKNSTEKRFYFSKYLERLLGVFGSAAEAAIEYNLIQGIIANKITTPADLDSITFLIGSKYRDYSNSPEQKGFWMRLETNFKAPLHNINDMMASLLAIQYFQQFLKDKNSFSVKFTKFLRNGYTDNPSNLLRNFMGINFNNKDFCKDAIKFVKSELLSHNKE
jgi:oligoendopeptidase F